MSDYYNIIDTVAEEAEKPGYRRNLPCYCHEGYVKYLCLSSWQGDVPLVNVAGGSLLYPLCVDSVDMIPLNVFCNDWPRVVFVKC